VAGENIQLVVGLGNPGNDYLKTRHNVGFWFVDELLNAKFATKTSDFSVEKKFFGEVATLTIASCQLRLLKPLTFMNRSGQAIQALTHFYQIPAENILVVHDDLDLSPGYAKLKKTGGHGGHNGLRDSIDQLKSKNFCRLRIGIGHPGNKHQVSHYVLGPPSKSDQQLIVSSLDKAINVVPHLIGGDFATAMQQLHSEK